MMRVVANKRIRAWLTTILAASGLTLINSPASAALVSIDLCAKDNPAWTLTGSVTVPIWGFVQSSDCSTATASLPGPVLAVNEGDVVTLNVINALPPATAPLHTISLEIPGVNLDPSSDAVTDVGESAQITFTANNPGTYLYQSAGDSGRQLAMGLYGALIVRPLGTPTQAYNPASTAFNVEAPLVLSQVDPLFNANPDTFDMMNYLATYWLINGKSYPDTAPITATGGQKVLVRYLNAGYDNTSMSLLGTHEHVIARDSHLVASPFDANAETIPAGETEDVIITVPSTSPPSTHGFPLFNRNLHVTNGSTGTGDYAAEGGMLTFISP